MSAETNADAISTALTTLAARVTIANGFSTDAGLQVYEGREGFSAEDTFPLICVVYPGAALQKSYPGPAVRGVQLGDFELSGLIMSDPENPKAAPFALLADFKRAIFGASRPADLDSIVIGVEPVQESLLKRVDGGNLAQVTLVLRIQWRELFSS